MIQLHHFCCTCLQSVGSGAFTKCRGSTGSGFEAGDANVLMSGVGGDGGDPTPSLPLDENAPATPPAESYSSPARR